MFQDNLENLGIRYKKVCKNDYNTKVSATTPDSERCSVHFVSSKEVNMLHDIL